MTWVKKLTSNNFLSLKNKVRFGNHPYIENTLYQQSGGSYIIEGEQNPETPDCSKIWGRDNSNVMGIICLPGWNRVN